MNWIASFFSSPAPQPHRRRKYQWKRDTHDMRDHVLTFQQSRKEPDEVDLRDRCPPVWDQKTLGCCTAESVSAAYMFDEEKEDVPNCFSPSIMFLYFNTRCLEHTVDTDSGATLRDTVKTLADKGTCDESMWPFDPDKFADKPPAECYSVASQHKALQYKRVNQNQDQIEACLASGYPICFGVLVYSSFEGADVTRTGRVPLPDPDRETLLGGHAILLVGYHRPSRRFIFRNSWGIEWGDKGYGYLDYDYVLNRDLSSDFWVIMEVD